MNDQQKAYVYAGIAIFFWSTVASAFKIGLREIDFIQFLFFATWTSFLILLLINLVRLVSLFFIGVYWPKALDVMHEDVWQAAFIVLAIVLWAIWVQWATRPGTGRADVSG